MKIEGGWPAYKQRQSIAMQQFEMNQALGS